MCGMNERGSNGRREFGPLAAVVAAGGGHRDVYVPLYAACDTVGDVRNVAVDGVVAHRRSGFALACRRNVVHGVTICFPGLRITDFEGRATNSFQCRREYRDVPQNCRRRP